MPEEVKAVRNEYYRQWRARNPDKVAAINRRYWERKLEQMKDDETRAAAAADPAQAKVSQGG